MENAHRAAVFDDPVQQQKYELECAFDRGRKEGTRSGIHWLLGVFIPCLILIAILAFVVFGRSRDVNREREARNEAETQLAELKATEPKTVEKIVEKIREVPRETVRTVEVPKDVVRTVEVPKEIIRTVEVPAKLTADELAGIDTANRLKRAPLTHDMDEALFKIDSLRVHVRVNQDLKNIISEDKLRTKFELALRRYKIPIDEDSLSTVMLTVEGFKSEETGFYSYTITTEVTGPVFVARKGDFRIVTRASLWQKSSYGFAGTKVFGDHAYKGAEDKAEYFANKFLAAQEKYK